MLVAAIAVAVDGGKEPAAARAGGDLRAEGACEHVGRVFGHGEFLIVLLGIFGSQVSG